MAKALSITLNRGIYNRVFIVEGERRQFQKVGEGQSLVRDTTGARNQSIISHANAEPEKVEDIALWAKIIQNDCGGRKTGEIARGSRALLFRDDSEFIRNAITRAIITQPRCELDTITGALIGSPNWKLVVGSMIRLAVAT
ncbi:hypothetical protein QAD02_015409 [Eretmocerus hayati]|uniref:Uncharacterized protein n=1 Tax=Eretmocerus hayati TaxID=131215 RepID=A0ACC2P868_9HYME|nr:hypothetical protein QAD02_015409 [Eretmocerus hayati]